MASVLTWISQATRFDLLTANPSSINLRTWESVVLCRLRLAACLTVFGFDRIWVFVGTLDRPDEVRKYMRVHLGVESEISWLTTHDDLPRKRTEEESSLLQLD